MNNVEFYIKELRKIYSEIPKFECKPKCVDCCGPIMFTALEYHLIGKKIPQPNSMRCPFVEKGGCSIYENRPLVCRLFGAVQDKRIMCSFGCCPTFRLHQDYAQQSLARVFELSVAAGNSAIIDTHEFFKSLVSPSKINLPHYEFR